MKDLLEVIAKRLVDKPENVEVLVKDGNRGSVLELRVDADDIGKVIGKQGKIAKAIRAVIRAAAIHNKEFVSVDIVPKD
ncbi:MAG: KH domain-containing protein [Defluviitaleaceae bacterium]|nr:KH domain-containing protein [Defluviitaleaceae bacterium]